MEAHAGQTRKGSEIPYITHPVHVAMILARHGAPDVVLQAALLHDVVEDCDAWTVERLEAEFGADVAAIVSELTEEKGLAWEERKQAAVDHVPHMSEGAALVKAADKLHNLSTLLGDLEEARHPDEVWRHFSRDARQTIDLAGRLATALGERLPGSLTDALGEALARLEGSQEAS